MYTYNQIVQINKDFWTAHKQIKSHYHDRKNKPTDVKYNAVYSNGIPFVLEGNELTYGFDVTILDRPNRDKKIDNDIDIVSDCLQIALDYVAYFRKTKFAQMLVVNLTSEISLVEGLGEDDTTGVNFKIGFKQAINWNLCQLPISGVPVDVNENVAFIVGTDGDIKFRLPMRARYTVEELLEIIDTIDSNTTSIIDPLT